MAKLIAKYQDRSVSHISFQHEPQPGYARKLSEAFEVVYNKHKVNYVSWATSPDKYFLKHAERGYMLIFDFNRIGFLGIGVEHLLRDKAEIGEIIRLAYKSMGIDAIKRSGLRITAYVPVDMSHPEIAELMFGSFLQTPKAFEQICGEPDDALLQVHGTKDGLKTMTVISAMNAEQAAITLMNTPNLEILLEPRNYDDKLMKLRDRIAMDCLLVDNDLHQIDLEVDGIPDFISRALVASEYMTEAVVYRLRSLSKKGSSNGNSK